MNYLIGFIHVARNMLNISLISFEEYNLTNDILTKDQHLEDIDPTSEDSS